MHFLSFFFIILQNANQSFFAFHFAIHIYKNEGKRASYLSVSSFLSEKS